MNHDYSSGLCEITMSHTTKSPTNAVGPSTSPYMHISTLFFNLAIQQGGVSITHLSHMLVSLYLQ